MNQFHLYPHQIYRRNTRNSLYTDENRTESPVSTERIRTLNNPKEINISDFEYQKQQRNATVMSPTTIALNKNKYQRSPSINSKQINRNKSGSTEYLEQSQNSGNDLKYDNSTRVSSRRSKQRQISKPFYEDDDDKYDIFDKKPKSLSKIGQDQYKGYNDALLIIEQNQNDKTPNFNKRQSHQINEIYLFSDHDKEFNQEYRPSSSLSNQNTHKTNKINSFQNRGSIEYKNSQDYEKTQQQQQIRSSSQNISNNQSFTDIEHDQRRHSNSKIIDINFQDIGLDPNVLSSQKNQECTLPTIQKYAQSKNKEEEYYNEFIEKDQNKQYNSNRLMNKYNLEQEYLQGFKGINKNNMKNSVLNENNIRNNSEDNIQERDDPEDVLLNFKIQEYRKHHKKNIDLINKQFKTECNSPSNRSIHEENNINLGMRSKQKKVKTEPNEDLQNHNLTISKPYLNYNSVQPKYNYNDIEDSQYIGQKAVPIHVILEKIRSRSQYTQKLERLTQTINSNNPQNTLTSTEDINNSQISNEYIKLQRQNITSKKYSNLYSKTIDQIKDYDSVKRYTGGNNLNNSNWSNSNGLTIRNSQKSKIFGVNKTIDVQKLNEEIDLLEEQSQAYQKSLNTTIEIDSQNTLNQKKSLNIDQNFKNTLNKQDNQENPRDIAKQLVKSGLVCYSENQYQVASQKLLKAQQILKRESLQKDILYHWIQEHLGNIYRSWGEIDQAFIYYKECYQIRKKLDNPNIKQLVQSALNVAQILIQNENYQNATSYLQELLQITSANMKKNNEWRVKVQLTLAICYGQCKEYKSAYNIIYEQLELIMTQFDLKNNKDILELIIQSVEVIENEYIKKDILSFYQKIKQVIINSFGPTNEMSLKVKERIEELSAYF